MGMAEVDARILRIAPFRLISRDGGGPRGPRNGLRICRKTDYRRQQPDALDRHPPNHLGAGLADNDLFPVYQGEHRVGRGLGQFDQVAIDKQRTSIQPGKFDHRFASPELLLVIGGQAENIQNGADHAPSKSSRRRLLKLRLEDKGHENRAEMELSRDTIAFCSKLSKGMPPPSA
jgi:hypothetical protein